MGITEATLTNWLFANWPSAAIGLSAATTFVLIYSRLRAFLDRIEATEKELIQQAKEIWMLKKKVSKLILTHCQRHSDDMPSLMKIEEDGDDG